MHLSLTSHKSQLNGKKLRMQPCIPVLLVGTLLMFTDAYIHTFSFLPYRCIGDHRGDRQKFFATKHVKLLTKDELAYISELVSTRRKYDKIICPFIMCMSLKVNSYTQWHIS